MLVWSQTAPSGTASAACSITARTAAVSVSIVITNAASRAASAGVSARSAPSAASTRLLRSPVPRADTEARLQEAARHWRAHYSGAEKRDPLSHQPVTLSARPRQRAALVLDE